MLSSKNVLRSLKNVAAVSKLSLPAWCCGPMRSIWGRPIGARAHRASNG